MCLLWFAHFDVKKKMSDNVSIRAWEYFAPGSNFIMHKKTAPCAQIGTHTGNMMDSGFNPVIEALYVQWHALVSLSHFIYGSTVNWQLATYSTVRMVVWKNPLNIIVV